MQEMAEELGRNKSIISNRHDYEKKSVHKYRNNIKLKYSQVFK